MTKKSAGLLMIGGGIAAAIGAVVYYRSKEQGGVFGSVTKTRRGGMTLSHHRDWKMGIRKRVGLLQDLTYKSIQDPKMRREALAASRSCEDRDKECEARAVYNNIRSRVRYTGDVAPVKLGRNGPTESIDLFQSAARTLEFGGGDCDDHSVLAATLLSLNGIPAKFRITSKNPHRGVEDWSHIYVVAGFPVDDPKKWVAVDTTLPGDYYGVEAPYGKKVDFDA